MAPAPTLHEETFKASMQLAHGEIGITRQRPSPVVSTEVGKPNRMLSIYPAQAGYDLHAELDFLSNRAMEPNVFFTSRFLAPAMPRLEDREVRLAVIRDETEHNSRLRLLLPFSVERPGFAIGAPIIRAWANPFGPLGTPLVDAEGAAETIDHFLEALGREEMRLPSVLVMPDCRINGPFAQMVRAIAMSRNLPVDIHNEHTRPMLESMSDGETYLKNSIKSSHMREMRRQWGLLEKLGRASYEVARQPADVRVRMEEFLLLEASGWKGRKRTAMLSDRLRAAFAREAVFNLAEIDAARIHTIDLDGKAIASMIVLMMNGEAYTWKTAYNENYAHYSPGKLLVAQITDWHLDDANIVRTDSCAVPDHPIMSRFWQERETMGTLIIGLKPNADREVRQVGTQLHLYQSTRNVARMIREKMMSFRRR
jgi:CelD/BcsL family acetyltransferase involved in cellulose biosynthesis